MQKTVNIESNVATKGSIKIKNNCRSTYEFGGHPVKVMRRRVERHPGKIIEHHAIGDGR